MNHQQAIAIESRIKSVNSKGYAKASKKKWEMACDDFLSFVKSDLLRKYKEYSTIQPFDYMQFSNSKGQSYTEKDRLFKIIRLREGKDRQNRVILNKVSSRENQHNRGQEKEMDRGSKFSK